MAYVKIPDAYYKACKAKIERLMRFNNPFKYTEDISLAGYVDVVERLNMATIERNEAAANLDAKTITYNQLVAEEASFESSLRNMIGNDKKLGRNSDEYVAAGGVRQSDITAQAQQTREANKRDKDKDK
ncbi:MAG: hypothetical protein JNL70_23200 [Saprospiraceae bacterium]|nr:hypothetical protein [Saprospiraceae bacterium]